MSERATDATTGDDEGWAARANEASLRAMRDRTTTASLPPSYWIDQIRADLKRRRDETNPTKPETATPESESADE